MQTEKTLREEKPPSIIVNGFAIALLYTRRKFTMKLKNNEIKSSAHSKYRCQYHIVFALKYRRKESYGKLKKRYG